MDALRTAVLVALALFAAGYALWVARWFLRGQRTAGTKQASPPKAEARLAIIGKSRFTMPHRSQATPTAATGSENVKEAEKAGIFAGASVHEYPRQIPPEKLDEVFGVPPAGENNDPEPYEAPLYEEEPFPDFEAEIEREMDEDEGEHDDTQPPAGRSLAKGVRFEQISEAYRTVAHDNPLTDEKQQETGRTLLGLKQTDMFEAIVSAAPDGNDKVSRLIDAYLTAFQRRIAAEDAGGPSPQAPVPEGSTSAISHEPTPKQYERERLRIGTPCPPSH